MHTRDSNPQKSFSGHSRKAIRRFKATLLPEFSTQSVKEGEKLSLFHTYHFLTMADANFVVDAFWGTKCYRGCSSLTTGPFLLLLESRCYFDGGPPLL